MNKSADAFRTIREVADWLGVAAHVLRFWESKFSQVKPVKRAGGRRYYRPSDMQLLGGIKVLLHDRGMTVRGVQRLLREEGTASVAALSPPLELIEASPDLVEGIGEEAPWHADAEAERDAAAEEPEAQAEPEPRKDAASAPSQAKPDRPPSLPGFEPSEPEVATGESQAEKAAARLAALDAEEDAPGTAAEDAPSPEPAPAPMPEPDGLEASPDPLPAPAPEARPEPAAEAPPAPEPLPEPAPEAEQAVAPEVQPEPASTPEPEGVETPEPAQPPEPHPIPEPGSGPVFASNRGAHRAAEATGSPAKAPPILVDGEGLDALAAFATGAATLPAERRARLVPAISALRALQARIAAPLDLPGGPGEP